MARGVGKRGLVRPAGRGKASKESGVQSIQQITGPQGELCDAVIHRP